MVKALTEWYCKKDINIKSATKIILVLTGWYCKRTQKSLRQKCSNKYVLTFLGGIFTRHFCHGITFVKRPCNLQLILMTKIEGLVAFFMRCVISAMQYARYTLYALWAPIYMANAHCQCSGRQRSLAGIWNVTVKVSLTHRPHPHESEFNASLSCPPTHIEPR